MKKASNLTELNPAPYGRWWGTLHLTRQSDGSFRLTIVDMPKWIIEANGESHEILKVVVDATESAIPDFHRQVEMLK